MTERRGKYNARKVEADGHTFDSGAEHRRYQELKLLQKAGEIEGLTLQPYFELQPKFTDVSGKKHGAITYRADFLYYEDDHIVVEDVKGARTAVFNIKEKMFLYRYPEYDFRVVEEL